MADLDITDLKDYLDQVKTELGTIWVTDAEKIKVVSYKSLGAVAFEYATACYMNGVTVGDCADTLRTRF